MDFTIRRAASPTFGSSQAGTISIGSSSRTRVSEAPAVKTDEAPTDAVKASLTTNQVRTGSTATPYGVESLASVAQEATSTIASLRAEQADLAAQAEGLSVGKQLTTINSLFSDLQDQINRVATTATYNGRNALSGGTYGTGKDGSSAIVALPNSSAITRDLGVSLTDPNNAETVYSTVAYAAGDASHYAINAATATAAAAAPAPKEPPSIDLNNSQDSADNAKNLSAQIARPLTKNGVSEVSADELLGPSTSPSTGLR